MDKAKEVAQEILSRPSSPLVFSTAARLTLGLLDLKHPSSPEVYDAYLTLIGQTGRMVWFHHVSADRMLGLLATAMGHWGKAEEHFEDALTFCQMAGFRPELAWTGCDYADLLIQQVSEGSADAARDAREKAVSLLTDSLDIASELGMSPLIERVESRLEDLLQSPPTAAPVYPDGLTQREAEVLQLLAQGKSNREIGDELVISESTARRHVSNIFDKIGVNNRTEAARYALREGLVSLG